MQRALWVFLFYTLVGPFVSGLLAAGYVPVAIWANLAPYAAGDHASFDVTNLPDVGGLSRLMAEAGVRTFVWSPIAAGLTGLGVGLLAWQRGSAHWGLAGAIAVVAFFVAYVLAPFAAGEMLALFAFAAGVVAAVIALFLRSIGVLGAVSPK
jgi:hypothetical protein